MLAALGPDKKAAVLFITVDPERDTPAVLKDYLSSFDPRIVGSDRRHRRPIAAAGTSLSGLCQESADEGRDYTMDHTAVVYLMDKHGGFVESFNPELDKPKEAAEALSRFL